jgi:hypothetical protein
VTAQPTQGTPLLCMTRKAKTADGDLETRRGTSDKLTTATSSSAPAEQSRDGEAARITVSRQLLHAIIFKVLDAEDLSQLATGRTGREGGSGHIPCDREVNALRIYWPV